MGTAVHVRSSTHLADFYYYISLLSSYWLAFMSAGPFLVDRLITWFWPGGRRTLDALPHRRQIFLWLIIFGVFWSGYSAWREANGLRVIAEKARDGALGERDEARRELTTRPDTTQTDNLRKQLADAVGELATLKNRIGPRHLTDEGHSILKRFSINISQKSVRVDRMSNNESKEFAEELQKVFDSSRWTIIPPKTILSASSYPRGVGFSWKSGDRPPAWIDQLAEAMTRSGIRIDPSGTHDNSLPDDNAVALMVGEKE